MTAVAPLSASTADLAAVVERARAASRSFVRLPIAERISLLRQLRRNYAEVAEEQVRRACEAKGLDFDDPISGEEWLVGPLGIIRSLRLLEQSLRDIERSGVPRVPGVRSLEDGRLAVRVFPTDGLDGFLLAKHEAEAYLQPGITADNLKDHLATFYRNPHGGRVCVVLGAGNVNSIPALDSFHKLFNEGTVCILKMNPVNAYLGPIFERAFKPLVDKGYLAIVYGGAEEGTFLVNHPGVDEVHITGSDKTHDLIVWGPPGPERDARKARNEPLLTRAITSELGNISPVLVVPGPYSAPELAYQAGNIAGMVVNNASFNCTAAKVLVTAKGWEGRQAVLDAVAHQVARGQVRKAYYPGAEERWKRFTDGRNGLRVIGNAAAGQLPYAIIPDVDAGAPDRLFEEEPWCSVMSETALEAESVPAYLERAVSFLNERLWGTLGANLVVHPKTLADPKNKAAFEKAIRDLRYGSVAVNSWAGAIFGMCSTPWGGHPSSTLSDIQSGRGFGHNTYMIDGVEKVVLRAPLKAFPVAPWFPGHRTVHQLAKKLTALEADPSWLKVPGIASTAMRG